MKLKFLALLWLCAGARAAAQSDPPTADATGSTGSSAAENFDLASALVSRTPDGLTAEEVARRARAYAPQIVDTRAAARVARSDDDAQRIGYVPTLSGFGAYTRLSRVQSSFDIAQLLPPQVPRDDIPSFVLPENAYQLGLVVRYPISDVLLQVLPRQRATDRLVVVRELEVASKTADVELTARESFYAYARARATLLVAQQALQQALAQADQARHFVEVGTAAGVELSNALARVALMRSQVARAVAAVAVTQNVVATLTGTGTTDVGAIREHVAELPPAPSITTEELLARGLRARPELAAMRALIDASTEEGHAEKNAALPSLSAEGAVLYANPNPRYVPIVSDFKTTWQVGASVSWSPNQAMVAHRRKQKKDAERDRLRAALRAAEDMVRIEVVQAWEEYNAAVAGAGAAAEEQRAAEHTYHVRLAKYRESSGVQIDLLAADLLLTDSRLHYINAVIDARVSLARLQHATGSSP